MTAASSARPMRGHRALVTGASMSIGRSIALAFAEAGADLALHHSAAVDRSLRQSGAIGEVAASAEASGVRTCIVDLDRHSLRPDVRQSSRRSKPSAASMFWWSAPRCKDGKRFWTSRLIDCLADAGELRRDDRPVAGGNSRNVRQRLGPHPDDRQRQFRTAASGIGRLCCVEKRPENFSLGLARSLAASGITVNVLSPGLIATERNRSRRADAEAWATIQRLANPMGRAGLPDEMASAAVLLCSRANAFMTGADLQVTGGGHL